MAGTVAQSTANTQVVVGNINVAQDAIQTLITAGKTIVSVTQAKAATWLIVFTP